MVKQERFAYFMENNTPKYKRILLKLSGEALAPKDGGILNFDFIYSIADVLKKCLAQKVQIGVIVGAGNIWRGAKGVRVDRVRADHMGMLATTINALALQDAFIASGIDAKVMTAVQMEAFADPYVPAKAIAAMEEGKIVIFGCGLGAPFFSTYTADPRVDATARRYPDVTYKEVLEKELKALDLTATTFCMEHDITAYAFELKDPMNIYRVVMGEKIGTELHR